jgi:hypothetical protein
MVARLDRALDAARNDNDINAVLRYSDFLSHVLSLHDDTDRAVTVTEEAIGIARSTEHLWWAQLVQRAAVFARMSDDLATATDLASEVLILARRLQADRLVLHANRRQASRCDRDARRRHRRHLRR